MRDTVINMDPETMGGTPVFRGTRVPIQTFIEHLEYEEGIDDFFDGFPGVSREQVIKLIEELDNVKEKLLARA
uniref:Uncharacterized conserved protein, DUF433 family n=1 Tax=Candidatus Kentrum sp. DK TaxID=2126562 RepID=A0A450S436_9GAMM|nr:MAG: Uncharacterized conserved protein, DUF433 family [Candidatus Kentron sp. DK]